MKSPTTNSEYSMDKLEKRKKQKRDYATKRREREKELLHSLGYEYQKLGNQRKQQRRQIRMLKSWASYAKAYLNMCCQMVVYQTPCRLSSSSSSGSESATSDTEVTSTFWPTAVLHTDSGNIQRNFEPETSSDSSYRDLLLQDNHPAEPGHLSNSDTSSATGSETDNAMMNEDIELSTTNDQVPATDTPTWETTHFTGRAQTTVSVITRSDDDVPRRRNSLNNFRVGDALLEDSISSTADAEAGPGKIERILDGSRRLEEQMRHEAREEGHRKDDADLQVVPGTVASFSNKRHAPGFFVCMEDAGFIQEEVFS